MAVQKINNVEKIFVLGFTIAIDVFAIAISWIPGLDLIGWPLKIFGAFALNVYFLLKLGTGYLGGKRSGQKMANVIINSVIEAIPAIDDFIPSLTIQAGTTFWITDKEAAEHEAAASSAKAANDKESRQKLSRAA